MSKPQHSGSGPSQRMLRVAELIRHCLAEILARGGVDDPVLAGHVVTVPDVRMSPDLKLATVSIMPLGGKDVPEVIAALERHRKFLRGEVAHRINLKYAPELRFKADRGFEAGARIDAILASPRVRADIASAGEPQE